MLSRRGPLCYASGTALPAADIDNPGKGDTMNPKNMRRALLAALVSLPLAAAAEVKVPEKIAYDKNSAATDTVKKECALDTKIPQYVKSAAGANGKGTLEMRITNVLAPGGGAWSGPKAVTVAGTLRDGGKVVGTFTARRQTTRGGYGTCQMLERDAEALGKDIGGWLKSPSMDARLGDAK
jgi:hypothetical protein